MESLVKILDTSHKLVSYSDWQREKSGRYHRKGDTDKLKSFDFLCHANSREHTNIVVCGEVRGGGCQVKDAVFVCNPAKGCIKKFEPHAERHKLSHRPAVPRKLTSCTKAQIVSGAVLIVVKDSRPFSFAKESGMKVFGRVF